MSSLFKIGDVIQHHASGEKAIIVSLATYTHLSDQSYYFLSYGINKDIMINTKEVDLTFHLLINS